jgi:uncharacterized membrane protein
MALTDARTTGPTWRTRTAFWWFGLTALAVAVLAPLQYALVPLSDLARTGSELAANYAGRPAPLQVAFALHVGFGGLALLLSPLQFVPRLRDRGPAVHRAVGRVVLGSIAVAGTAGLVLAPHSLAGGVGTAGFGLLAVLWLGCAATALRAILRGDVAAHRRWVVRTFALTYAAVTLRLWLAVLIAAQVALAGVPEQVAFQRAYLLVPFLAWVPNLLVAERYLTVSRRLPAARQGTLSP